MCSSPDAPALPGLCCTSRLCAVGVDQAILELPTTWPMSTLKGWLVGLSWRGFETSRQVSSATPVELPAPFSDCLRHTLPLFLWLRESQMGNATHAAVGRLGRMRCTRASACREHCRMHHTVHAPPHACLPLQVSARNRWMVQSDWLRTKLFGRNITEV